MVTVIVFVHGWSVTNTDTYGGLPDRLRAEAAAQGIAVQIKNIYLGRYISFHDEVRVSDISRAFRTAVADQLTPIINAGTRFVCITHSTGGPVVRDWWHRYYETDPTAGQCPMSHLVMLAPANYGSALAQLGKGRVSRMKSWFEGVEPGQGVLDWLELGSKEAWALNSAWIVDNDGKNFPNAVFPFVLTGQSIDRAFYDNLNTYTGELGSDGVVRVAAANLCSTYILLEQDQPQQIPGAAGYSADALVAKVYKQAPKTALRVIGGKSHSGKTMGIMRSVDANTGGDAKSMETVNAILACIQVDTADKYAALCKQFENETEVVQRNELLEVETHLFLSDTYFIHDKYSMVIFKVRDDQGYPVTDYDLVLTAGPSNDPNHLPQGFCADKQRNSLNPETITYFFDYDIMSGSAEVRNNKGEVIRQAIPGATMLGFKLTARPDSGFVHYLPCEIKATAEMLQKALLPNSTTLVEIVLKRIVTKNVFLVEQMTPATVPVDFSKTVPGDEIVG
jgi:hypothetical protein